MFGIISNVFYKLDKLEYLQEQLGGKSFQDIEGTQWARRIYSIQIIGRRETLRFDATSRRDIAF